MCMFHRKGISIAIFGFVTIGLIIAGLIWVQYNSSMGIQQKLSSGENMVFERLSEESVKIHSYAESSLGLATINALAIAAKNGGRSDDVAGYWQCLSPSVPDADDILAGVDERALLLSNAYISLIGNKDDRLMFKINNLSCVNAAFPKDDSPIFARGSGFDYNVTDGDAFLGSGDLIIEKTIGLENYWSDYLVLKKWVENNEIKRSIEIKLNDAAFVPQGLSYGSCSCSSPQCPSEENIMDMTYPCWQSGIQDIVRGSVDEAVMRLKNDGMYFGGKRVICESKISCISIRKPVIVHNNARTYSTSKCCSGNCTGCIDDSCAIRTTEKICSGVSVESVCKKPDCERSQVMEKSCIVSLKKQDFDKSAEFGVGDLQNDQGICESCCSVSFGLVYDIDVDLSVTCTDTSTIIPTAGGLEPFKWKIRLFIATTSKNGAYYQPDVGPGCL